MKSYAAPNAHARKKQGAEQETRHGRRRASNASVGYTKHAIRQKGRLLGQRALGAKILNRQRGLSVNHIKTLAKHFAVSPALFLPH
jgi:hypothetical protein